MKNEMKSPLRLLTTRNTRNVWSVSRANVLCGEITSEGTNVISTRNRMKSGNVVNPSRWNPARWEDQAIANHGEIFSETIDDVNL